MAKLPKALNLSDVLLGDVKISEKITSGTFVRVLKVYHKETIFAAKVFFYSDSTVNRDTGFDTKGNPRNENAKRLLQECHRCKKLDHSNVIRLIGLYYKEKSAVPTLIVEKLRETLNYFLVKNPDVEFACKLSILLDVAKGLMYLHSQDPQIAHGCLTSKNVLLTDQRRAKITGDSAVTSLLKQTTSRRPTQTYGLEVSADFFPCETRADRDSRGVDPRTDVFSYGGIILHTLTQMWPKPESRVSCRGHAGKPISEIDRRRKYFADIDDHRFEELVKSCMDDDSRVRLTIVKVHAILQKIECEEMLPPPAPATKDSVRHSASEDTGTARQVYIIIKLLIMIDGIKHDRVGRLRLLCMKIIYVTA